jgi:hypothetical protein
VFDFHLTPKDLDRFSTLDRHRPPGLDPESFGH